MADFLLEIFSEEIPARMQADASRHLLVTFGDALKSAALTHDSLKSFVTPRRLALLATGLPTQQQDAIVEKKGPKTSAPQAATDGFLKSNGLTLAQLEKRMLGKDETYFAVMHQKGQPTAKVLKSIVGKILAGFPWPKSMRWGSGETRWVRPLHSILCIFDGDIVPVEFAGLQAGNVTYGHRFLAPDAITITKESDYEAALEKASVLADADRRKAEILRQAEALADQHGLSLKRDDGLLNEVTGLVEWPVALMGMIDAAFMDLPPEVLTSEMRAHQKYFVLTTSAPSLTLPLKEEGNGEAVGVGQIAPRFVIISNMVAKDKGQAIIAGNERVLRARLSDGRFFFDQDRKKPLSEWAKGLADVTFHAKVGTIAQKVERIKALAVKLAAYVPGADKNLVEQAAELCKADLTTGMIGEFPELQGVMGRYYALAQGEEPQVADAIRDHYLPLGPDSPVPLRPVSICIALADKLDTLISLFAAGEKPTGSKDPFALRRSALGVIRIILENTLRLPLKAFLNEELIAFFRDRLKAQLKDQGIRHDVIDAVTANGDDDLVRVVERAKALQMFLATEDGGNLLTAYRRAANIVDQAEKKDGIRYEGSITWELLQNEYEHTLAKALSDTRDRMRSCRTSEDFDGMMKNASCLRGPIDAFFTNILVNAEDERIRRNRLSMLTWIREVFNVIANFALIEG